MSRTLTRDIALLPMPQRLDYLDGTHELGPDRFIWIDGDPRPDLLRAGKIVKEALEAVGQVVELTAARVGEADRLEATLRVDPNQVSRPQGYHLAIMPDSIDIIGHDAAGVFYGAMTLK